MTTSQILRRPRMSGATNLLICTILRLASLSACFPIRDRPRVEHGLETRSRFCLQDILVKGQLFVLLEKLSGSTVTMCRYLIPDEEIKTCTAVANYADQSKCVYTHTRYIPQAAYWLVKQTNSPAWTDQWYALAYVCHLADDL
jgi:hypothetical protein